MCDHMHRLPLALVAALGLGAGACATNPDVVATVQTLEAGSDAPFVTPIHGCYPGTYLGRFNYAIDVDAAIFFPVSVVIEFTLVEANSGEFLIVQSGAKLSGKPDQGNTISADIDTNVDGGSGRCYEGVFRVDLVHGKYDPGDAAKLVDFTGVVEGVYKANRKEFTGTWKAFVAGGFPISWGDWQAIRSE